MSIPTVARKDIADAGRSKSLWGVTLVVVLFTAGITGLVGFGSDEPATEVFRLAFQLAATTLPIVALILAKGALTGERESGSLRLLLSLPPSRRDILLGKFLGRTALMLVATAVGAVTTGLAVVALFPEGLVSLVPFVLFLGLMGTVFVGIGVGISAASARDSRATTAAVAVYLVLVVLWNLIAGGIQAGASALGLIGANSQPAWLQFVGILPPNRAAIAAFGAAVDGGGVFATDPFASVWFPTLLLLVWLVVPTAAGYLRFRKADIA